CLFFQAEDGIRDWSVTGVQTCALPILFKSRLGQPSRRRPMPAAKALSTVEWHSAHWIPTALSDSPSGLKNPVTPTTALALSSNKIGRASCRERVEMSAFGVG